MNRIVYPYESLLRDYARLRTRSTPFLNLPAGWNCDDKHIELLVGGPSESGPRATAACRVALARDLQSTPAGLMDSSIQGLLLLGEGETIGRGFGFIALEPGRISLANELRLVGPGMLSVALDGSDHLGRESESPGREERWSRTRGALGHDTWRRLASMQFTIIGAGRSGSLLAMMLGRLGVRSIRLIDPDKVELHNLGESVLFHAQDIGRHKVEVLAERLKDSDQELLIEAVPGSVTHLRAFRAVASADIVCCAADHNSARLSATYHAALFHKPLLDIGTAILRQAGQREMGVDIRLTWPGRCLLCAGGLRDEASARQRLTSADSEHALRSTPVDWRNQRAGSLASLNGLAVSAAVRLLEDFIAGRWRQNAAWMRLSYDENGRLAVAYPNTQTGAARGCACMFSGRGEEALAQLAAELTNGTRSARHYYAEERTSSASGQLGE